MKNGCVFLLYLFLVALNLVSEPAYAQSMRNMSILTGGPDGTYIKFGQNIREIIAQECGRDLQVKQSEGSLDNLSRLRYEPFTQLAIVQSDALEFLKLSAETSKELRDQADNFRYIFSLYPEEVHLLTRRDTGIRNIRDLRGRRVAVGSPKSGTNLTATLLLRRIGIDVSESRISGRDALELLLSDNPGERIDAMFYIIGKPAPLFSEDDGRYSNLRLVEIADPAIESYGKYNEAIISSSDYSWVEGNVKTVAVTAALISFDFRGEQCENVGMTAALIKRNIEGLQRQFGHPKWNVVDLDAPVPGWQRYDCATTRLNTEIIASGNNSCVFADAGVVESPGSLNQTRSQCIDECGDNALCKMLCPAQ